MCNKFYTVDQIADMLDMHPRTIRRYIRSGKLKANKLGKSWRISEYELKKFTNDDLDSNKTIHKNAHKVMVSAVVDIDVENMNEAMNYVNMLTAALNSKPPEYGRSTLTAQFLDTEMKVRIMLWGNIKFMSIMMSSIELLIGDRNENSKS